MPPIKRVVETAGNTVMAKRANLNPEKVEEYVMQPEATQVDGPQGLKGDFCSCSPVHLFLLNK